MKALTIKCSGEATGTVLHKIGEVCFRISGLTSGQLAKFNIEKTASTAVIKCRIEGDLQFTDENGTDNLGKELTLPTNSVSNNFYIKGVGDCLMFVGNKYNWSGFTIITDTPANVRVSYPDADFTYIPNLVRFRLYRPALGNERIDLAQLKGYPLQSVITRPFGGLYGDISNIANAANTSIEIQCQDYADFEPNVTGDISVFSNSTSITSLKLNYTKCYGDVASLSPLIALSSFEVRYSDISGNLEEMLNGMVTAGRTSGTLTVDARNSSVLLNGDVLNSSKTVTFTGSGWTIA